MGIQRLFTPSTSKNFTQQDDAVKSGQSNSATFAALTGVLVAAGGGIAGIIKATGVNGKTTTAQAAVIIAVLLFAAVGVLAVAWVLVADYKTRAGVTAAKGTNGTGAVKKAGAATTPLASGEAMLKIVDEQAELPVLTAIRDGQGETVYLAVVANSPGKWVPEKDVKHWVTPSGTDASTRSGTQTGGGSDSQKA